jgi:hypothetical protein
MASLRIQQLTEGLSLAYSITDLSFQEYYFTRHYDHLRGPLLWEKFFETNVRGFCSGEIASAALRLLFWFWLLRVIRVLEVFLPNEAAVRSRKLQQIEVAR